MNGSIGNNLRSVFLAVAAATAVLTAGASGIGPQNTARAQSADSAPTPLGAPLNLGAPRRSATPINPDGRAAIRQPTPGSSGEGRSGIEIQALGSVDFGSIGLLTQEQGGFPTDMWTGTDRSLVLSLLPKVPVDTTSRAVRILLRRLLLTAAAAPEGSGESVDLLIARVRALSFMGELEAARDLLQAIPERVDSLPLAQARVETALLLRDIDGACIAADRYVQAYDDPAFQKAQVICKARADQMDAAILALSVLRDSGHEDPGFYALMDGMISGSAPKNPTVEKPTAVILTGFELIGAALPKSFAEAESFGVLRAVSSSPVADLPLRLAAAERAETVGAVPTLYLNGLYGELQFKPEDLANALTVAQKTPGPRGRALLFQAVQSLTVPAAQAAVIKSAFDLTRGTPLFSTMARVFLPFLAQIEPSPELSFVAADAGRALIVAGQNQRALQWLTITTRRAASKDEQAAALSLWALARLAGIDSPIVPWETARLNGWVASELARDAKQSADKAISLYVLFESLGDSIPANAWTQFFAAVEKRPLTNVEDPTIAATAFAHGYAARSAASFDRVGETVLQSVLTFSAADPGTAPLSALDATIEALVSVGLDPEARTLALEAAVARGI